MKDYIEYFSMKTNQIEYKSLKELIKEFLKSRICFIFDFDNEIEYYLSDISYSEYNEKLDIYTFVVSKGENLEFEQKIQLTSKSFRKFISEYIYKITDISPTTEIIKECENMYRQLCIDVFEFSVITNDV